MRAALGATSPIRIDSETRDRPSRAPVATTRSVLNTAKGASSTIHSARAGLSRADAIQPDPRAPTRARMHDAAAASSVVKRWRRTSVARSSGWARDVEEQNEGAADAQRRADDAIDSEGDHHVAEAGLGQDAAEQDQHHELGREAEHPRPGAEGADPQVRAEVRTAEEAGAAREDPAPGCDRRPLTAVLTRFGQSPQHRLIRSFPAPRIPASGPLSRDPPALGLHSPWLPPGAP